MNGNLGTHVPFPRPSWTDPSSVETTYSYDANGNRTGMRNGDGLTSYSYDLDSNQLLSQSGLGGSIAYAYDDRGNMETKIDSSGTTTYAWGGKNELLSVSESGISATFTYDTQGRRLSKTVDGTTTEFVYDGITLVAEKDGSGNVTAKYFYDHLGQLLSMNKGGSKYFFHLNQRGDVVKITDEQQQVVASYSYDPWGNILESTGTFANEQPFRYAGYYLDSELGLYYVLARYYDSGSGRFISRDPFTGFAVEPITQRPYLYAGNSPIQYADPTGELFWPVPERGQLKKTWCAAAAVEMLIWYKMGLHVSQYDIVRYAFNKGKDVTDDKLPNIGLAVGQSRKVLRHWGLLSRGQDPPYTKIFDYRHVRAQIDLDRPFIANWRWYGNDPKLTPSHAVVVRGYDPNANNDVYFIDPWNKKQCDPTNPDPDWGLGRKRGFAWFADDNDSRKDGFYTATGHYWQNTIYDIHN